MLALVVPLQGPAGIYGPSCQVSAQLAVEELNATTGIGGRHVRILEVDGGRAPSVVAAEIDLLATIGAIDAVVGWHISAVRQAVVTRLAGRLPYVYTALYEGGERARDVFLTGETPGVQLRPAMAWLRQELGVRRWSIVGNDYVWPRRTAAAARSYARQLRCTVEFERYLPLGGERFGPILDAIERTDADAVLMLLVGQDMVHFNRQYAARGLDRKMVRFSTILDENALLGIGAPATRGLYSAAGYFGSLPTPDSLEFVGRISARFGAFAPTCTSLGESCYEGVRLLAQLLGVPRAEATSLTTAADGLRYRSPRGDVHLAANHLVQPVYLAAAEGVEFAVQAQITSLDT